MDPDKTGRRREVQGEGGQHSEAKMLEGLGIQLKEFNHTGGGGGQFLRPKKLYTGKRYT